jgi:hypothetical protein
MDFKKAKVEGRMSTVVSIEELQTNRELYDTGTVSVEITKTDGESVVLPYRPNAVRLDRPGVYQAGNVGDVIVYPDGFVKVVEIDELVTALDEGLITLDQLKNSLAGLDSLLQSIYNDKFDLLTIYIDRAEQNEEAPS